MIKNIPFKNGKKASQVEGSCCSWHLFTNTLRWKVTISGSSVDNINILEKRVAFKNWKEKCDFLNALFCDVNGSWKVFWWVLPRVNYIKTDLLMHCWFSATYSYLTITNLGKNAFFLTASQISSVTLPAELKLILNCKISVEEISTIICWSIINSITFLSVYFELDGK